MARHSLMNTHPELRDLVAELYVAGESNQSIANALNAAYPELNVHPNTITDYRRHDEVAPLITKLSEERRARLLRKVDSQLEAALEGKKLDAPTLIQLRKAIAPPTQKIEAKNTTGQSASERLWIEADKDPAAAQRLLEAGDEPG